MTENQDLFSPHMKVTQVRVPRYPPEQKEMFSSGCFSDCTSMSTHRPVRCVHEHFQGRVLASQGKQQDVSDDIYFVNPKPRFRCNLAEA